MRRDLILCKFKLDSITVCASVALILLVPTYALSPTTTTSVSSEPATFSFASSFDESSISPITSRHVITTLNSDLQSSPTTTTATTTTTITSTSPFEASSQTVPPSISGSQESLLSDIWSSLTTTDKNPGCPGECVHAIASIFCDKVLEEVSCGMNYLRCCVPNDSIYGTPVETSPPLIPDDLATTHDSNTSPFTSQNLVDNYSTESIYDTTSSSTQSTLPSSSNDGSSASQSNRPTTSSTLFTSPFKPFTTTSTQPEYLPESTTTASPTSVSFVPLITDSTKVSFRYPSSTIGTMSPNHLQSIQSATCRGICIHQNYSRFCGNVSSHLQCDHPNEICCLQSDSDSVLQNQKTIASKPPALLSTSQAATSFTVQPSTQSIDGTRDSTQTTSGETTGETIASLGPTKMLDSAIGTTSPSTTIQLRQHSVPTTTVAETTTDNHVQTSSQTSMPASNVTESTPSLGKPILEKLFDTLKDSLASLAASADAATSTSESTAAESFTQSDDNVKPDESVVTTTTESNNDSDQKQQEKKNPTHVESGIGNQLVHIRPSYSNESSLPPCGGTCVTTLFSLLCDEIDHDRYCPNEGRCCKYKDQPEDGDISVTSTPAPTTPAGPRPCPGTCIPTIFSGVCNRPSELILKTTNCYSGTICCHTPTDPSSSSNSIAPSNSNGVTDENELNVAEEDHNDPTPSAGGQYNHYALHPSMAASPPTLDMAGHWPPLMPAPSHRPPFMGNHQIPSNYMPHHPRPPHFMIPGHPNPPHVPIPNRYAPNGLRPPANRPVSSSMYKLPKPHTQSSTPSSVAPNLFGFPMPLEIPTQPHLMETLMNSGANFLNLPNSQISAPESTLQSMATGSIIKPNFSSNLTGLISDPFGAIPCPGPCIPHLFRFTCFGGNAIYPNLHCNKPQQLCCATIADVNQLQATHTNLLTSLAASAQSSLAAHLAQNLHSGGHHHPHNYHTQNNYTSIVAERSKLSTIPAHRVPIVAGGSGSQPLVKYQHSQNTSSRPKPGSVPGNYLSRPANSHSVPVIPNNAEPFTPIASKTPSLSNPSSYANLGHRPSYSHDQLIQLIQSGNFINFALPSTDQSLIPISSTTMTSTTTTIAPPSMSTTGRPEFASSSKQIHTCGVPTSSEQFRVVGGFESKPLHWCWQVALLDQSGKYMCGGALIGTQWVLTAAHCISKQMRNGELVYVVVGEHNLNSSRLIERHQVASGYIHHNHDEHSLENDIALLRLKRPLRLKAGVCLVCLPVRNSPVRPGTRCVVTGYGFMSESGPVAMRLRQAEIPIISESHCSSRINSAVNRPFVLPTSSFCAGGESGSDACQGDGGGPLVCEDEGLYELTGLVSWGFGCGRLNVPGVYVKVSSFINWINQIVSVNNNN